MQLICFRQDMLKKGESIDQVTSSTVWFCPQIKVIQSVAFIEEERNQINTLSPFFFLFFMNLLPFLFYLWTFLFFSPIFSPCLSIQ